MKKMRCYLLPLYALFIIACSNGPITFDPMPQSAQKPIKGSLYPFRSKITSELPKPKTELGRSMGYSNFERFRFGYMTKSGELAIPPQFRSAAFFTDHLAVVSTLRRVETENSVKVYTPKGAINRNGELVIPADFNELAPFSEGLARAKLPTPTFSVDREKGKIYEGYINTKGEFVIAFELGEHMEEAGDFSEGLAWIHPSLPYAEAKAHMSDKDVELLNQFFGGREVEGNYMVRTNYTPYGYINKSGERVIPARFSEVTPFSEGKAAVRDAKTQKWGFINQEGAWVIPAQYDDARPFSDGLAAVTLQEKCGYIDAKGELKLPLENKSCFPFSDGVSVIKNVDDQYQWLSIKGERNSLFKGEAPGKVYRLGEINEGLLSVKIEQEKGQSWCFVNPKGELVLPPQYSGYNPPKFQDGIARVQITVEEPSIESWNKGELVSVTKTGYIDLQGEWVIKPINDMDSE